MVITPQLQQAIKLLQLSNLELDAFVEAELERNPLLSRVESEASAEQTDAPDTHSAESEIQFQDGVAQGGESALDAPSDAVYDAAPGEQNEVRTEAQPGLSDWSRAGSGGGFENEDHDRPDKQETTLSEHLQAQAALVGFNPSDHAIALILIDSVDEGGYLRADLAEVAERLGVSNDRIENVLACCQGFEPTGVMARSICECLTLQLVERNRFDPA
ncbi:RNA polymerase factor sigma-54, partial [Brevundimonas sp.]|uniref:RNA polymerase factor sigma-54 n=1 Tax=Brevundimonas sp. TaxID=1871086 RepID=UPI003AA1BD09